MEAAVKRGRVRQTRRAGAKAKQIGRPTKDPSGKRNQVTILLRSDLKRALIKAAQEHGRTLSQEGEHWLERLLQYESVLGAGEDAVRPLLRHRGYIRLGISNPRTGQRGFAWAEPGLMENSGFIPTEEEPK
jgi:hypothetical protein